MRFSIFVVNTSLWICGMGNCQRFQERLFQTKLTHNLASDLERGRKFPCSFTDIYLSNVFSYQEFYHLVKPFRTFNFFPSIEIRRCIIRVLLYPRTFETSCPHCHGKFEDILKHFLFNCSFISLQRKVMNDKLRLYNFPGDTIYNIKALLLKL